MRTQLWDIERMLWLEGADFFADYLAEGAIMAFPDPVGILRGGEIVESLKKAPRWASVRMSDLEAIKRDGLAVLAYRAVGEREGEAPYEAICMSTYERDQGEWRIAAHQQTPV